MGPPAQEMHGPVRAGTPLPSREDERVELVQPGDGKASRRSCGLSILKESLYKRQRRIFYSACSDRTKSDGSKLKDLRFLVDIRKKYHTMSVVKYVFQRSYRWPTFGSVWGQVRLDFEHPKLVKDALVHSKCWTRLSLRVFSNTNLLLPEDAAITVQILQLPWEWDTTALCPTWWEKTFSSHIQGEVSAIPDPCHGLLQALPSCPLLDQDQ